MKKGKKDRGVAEPVRIKSRDKEVEMKDHLHALSDKKLLEVNKGKKLEERVIRDN